MAGTLAVPTFRTGASDELAAVDVYTQRSNNVINNTRDALSMPNFGSVGSLLGGKGLSGLLPMGGLGNLASSGIGALTKMAGVSNPKVLGAINKLTPIISNEINKKIASSPALANITAKVNGVTTVINAAQSGNAMGVIGAVNALTGAKPGIVLTDNKALSSFASGLLSQGVKAGVPGVFSAISGSIDSSTKFLSGVVGSVLPDINKTGSISALKEITDFNPKLISQVSGTGIQDFMKEYPLPPLQVTPEQYQQNYKDVTETMSKIDPNWLTAQRAAENGTIESCFNLTTVSNASPEMKKTLEIGALNTSINSTDKMFLLGTGDFKSASSPESLSTLYPAAFSAPAITQPVIQDPRQVQEVERLDREAKKQVPPPDNNLGNISDLKQDLQSTKDRLEKRIERELGARRREGLALRDAGAVELGNAILQEVREREAVIRAEVAPRIAFLEGEIKRLTDIYNGITIK